jgi:hypothetical protein
VGTGRTERKTRAMTEFVRLIEEEKINDEAQRFIEILQKIGACEEESLKQLLKNNASIIKKDLPPIFRREQNDVSNMVVRFRLLVIQSS